MIKADLIVANAAQLLTMSGMDLGLIQQGWLAVNDGLIVAVGSKEEVLAQIDERTLQQADYIDAAGKTVLPGFVDCHTHLVFGGDRIEEYAFKTSEGHDKPEDRYFGMVCSSRRTRQADSEQLYLQAAARLENMIANGSTTIECKSGYGLAIDSELQQLKTTQALAQNYPVDLLSTFLGAHGWPQDMAKETYLDVVVEQMLPQVAQQKLATFCDIWVDDGFFTAADAKRVLSAGLHHGLRPKIHAEAYSYIGGSDVAVELHAVSSDHLNYTPAAVMQKLSQAGVIGVMTPCTDYVVRHPKPANPQRMIENGLTVAVATNCNPGCWCTSMPFALQLAVKLNGMTTTQALRGATINGAKALALNDRGRLAVGCLADFQIWNAPRHEALFYRLGENVIEAVYKRGRPISLTRSAILM